MNRKYLGVVHVRILSLAETVCKISLKLIPYALFPQCLTVLHFSLVSTRDKQNCWSPVLEGIKTFLFPCYCEMKHSHGALFYRETDFFGARLDICSPESAWSGERKQSSTTRPEEEHNWFVTLFIHYTTLLKTFKWLKRT